MASSEAGRWGRREGSPELVKLWSAGGLREGEALALPVDLAASRTGRVAVTDFRLGEVVVLGPDGSWLGAWTRRGPGPGEVERPVASSWTDDGELVVFDAAGASVLWLDGADAVTRSVELDPSFTAPVVASGSMVDAAVAPRGDAYLQPGRAPLDGAARAVDVLLRYRPAPGVTDTVRVDTVPTLTAAGRFATQVVPGAPRLMFALGPAGRLVTGDRRGRYRLVEWSPDQTPVRVVCRPVKPEPLTREERGQGDGSDDRRPLADAIGRAGPPDRLAAFGSFFVGARGRMWVQRTRGDPFDAGDVLGTPGAVFDVFSPEGRYLGDVRAPDDARLRAARGDTVFGYEFGELDEPRVVAYRLEPRG